MCFPTCDTLRLLACVAQYKPTNHIHPNSTLGSGRRPPTPIATEITISNRRPLQSPLRGSRCAQPRPPPTPSLPTPPSPTSPRPASRPLSPPPSPSPKLNRATPPLPRPILPDTPITPPPPFTQPLPSHPQALPPEEAIADAIFSTLACGFGGSVWGLTRGLAAASRARQPLAATSLRAAFAASLGALAFEAAMQLRIQLTAWARSPRGQNIPSPLYPTLAHPSPP